MYRRTDFNQLSLFENSTRFTVDLNPNNRWLKLAEIMPWDKIDEHYAANMCGDNGAGTIPSRIAFGAIYAKENLKTTDTGILENIQENVYLQYFLGLSNYHGEPLFNSSMMVHFRNRFTTEFMAKVNDFICTGIWHGNDDIPPDDLPPPDESDDIKREGSLSLDATVAPSDIRYPNDVKLLNECRKNCEKFIDKLWKKSPQKSGKKTPYHRHNADKKFNKYVFNRKPSKAKTRAAAERELDYLKSAVHQVLQLILLCGVDEFSEREWDRFNTICVIYLQQKFMFDNGTNSHPQKIMNLRCPHVRAIYRGKAKSKYEYGQKMALSKAKGFVFIEHSAWENFNECNTLQQSIANFYRRFGHFPEVVLADKIYHTKDNKDFCKKYKIRLGGTAQTRINATDFERRQSLEDYRKRNEIEGINGNLKRRHGLDLIMCWTPHNAEIEAALQTLDLNLQRRLALLIAFLFGWLFRRGRSVFQ